MSDWKRDCVLVCPFLVLTIGLFFVSTGFEERVNEDSERCKGEIVSVDNSQVQTYGYVRQGEQDVRLRILDDPYKGEEYDATNQLMGRMDIDKLYTPGDIVLVVLSLDEAGNVLFVNPQDHYRLGLEVFPLILFAVLLVAFGGWTGAKALLSFIFTGLVLWKILIPRMLIGDDPFFLFLGIVALLTGAVIFLVAGPTKKGVVAFIGAYLGIGTSAALALYFTHEIHLHGAVMPFAETLLYSGFGHLDLTRIYVAAVFLAASGAVMDLAMDVAASMNEVVQKKPDITFREAAFSGLRVGRAVVGTMTTTLLQAYSGGYVTLLMAFMAQGVPLANLFNLIYVAAEVLKTLVGSFGLVLVAPFTAVIGAFVFTAREASKERKQMQEGGMQFFREK